MFNINMQEHKPLRELVYEELKLLIMTGQIEPGTRMMEIELAESMGVSRTPVREAIRQLEKDNLVTIEPRKGAYVSDISAEDFDSMMMVREPLEGLAAYLAAKNMTPEQIEEVKKAADACERAIASVDQEELTKTDTHFHRLITEGSGNTYLIRLCQELQEQVVRFRYIYFRSAKRAEEISAEHRMIVEAIASGDAERARSYSIAHTSNLRAYLYQEEDFHPGS